MHFSVMADDYEGADFDSEEEQFDEVIEDDVDTKTGL